MSSADPKPATRLRLGILGCSDIARRKFIPALLRNERLALAAIAGRERSRAAGFVAGHRYAACSYEELVSATDVDLVYVSLPNHLHEEWTIRALTAGKHVICEKPLGLSAASVERMLAAADERGLLLYENLMYLHHPQHGAVKRLLVSGTIGRLKVVRCVFGFPFPKAEDFRLDPLMGGGALHDLARYPLSAALFFLQEEPGEFQGIALDRKGLNLAMHGIAHTPAQEVFQYAIAFGQQYEAYYELVGEKGRIRVERPFTTPPDLANRIEVVCGTEDRSFVAPPADHFALMLDGVIDLLKDDDFGPVHARSRCLARLAEAMEKGSRHVQVNG